MKTITPTHNRYTMAAYLQLLFNLQVKFFQFEDYLFYKVLVDCLFLTFLNNNLAEV